MPELVHEKQRTAGASAASVEQKLVVSLIPGDGVGPEIMAGVRRLFAAAAVPIDWEVCTAGSEAFRKRVTSGVPGETVDSIARNRVVLKGPLETPVGYGGKSANVTLRKLFETFGNLRPVRELPGVPTPYAGRGIDLIVVRENVEDLYAGIEHMQSPGVAQCLKIVSRQGCERIARLAFETARAEGRRSVHCATKANIMKLTEGMMKRAFEDVAHHYPDIAAHHFLVDNCAHQLVKRPEQFEVIVTTNMNGDILSDLTSGLVGGLGFAPAANIGDAVCIFEAVHGSAPKYAGQDSINPTAGILSALMLLRHHGLGHDADRIERALLATLAAGIHTRDVSGPGVVVGTRAFVDAVIARLDEDGDDAERWPLRSVQSLNVPPVPDPVGAEARAWVGVDVFVESDLRPVALGRLIGNATHDLPFQLKMISNRGTQVVPPTGASPHCVDVFRCRFMIAGNAAEADGGLLELLQRIGVRARWMHVEKLQRFDGADGFTKAQGED